MVEPLCIVLSFNLIQLHLWAPGGTLGTQRKDAGAVALEEDSWKEEVSAIEYSGAPVGEVLRWQTP